MRHTIGALLATMVLSTSTALAQTAGDGAITGRLALLGGRALPTAVQSAQESAAQSAEET